MSILEQLLKPGREKEKASAVSLRFGALMGFLLAANGLLLLFLIPISIAKTVECMTEIIRL
jgi:hypothetical protein